MAALAFAIAMSSTLLLAPVAGAQEPSDDAPRAPGIPGALVTGAGKTTLPDTTLPEEYIGDIVSVVVTVHGQSDLSATGHFRVTHRTPTGELLADIRGNVDCLRTEGDFAVMTGTVTNLTAPDVPHEELHVGMAAAIVIEDAGASDTMIWRFGAVDTTCTEIPAMTNVPVEAGNFVVLD